MPAFPDDDTDHITRARDAYYVATGRTLDPHDAAIRWALDALSVPQVDRSQRRAVEMMAPWLDEVVSDPETRARLGLEPKAEPVAGLFWTAEDGGFSLYESERGALDALVCDVREDGWRAWMMIYDTPFARGPETGRAGMDAAERALIAAGVLPAGCTPRRPVML